MKAFVANLRTLVVTLKVEHELIVYSNAKDKTILGEGFQGQRYVTVAVRLALIRLTQEVCIDTKCIITFIDKAYLNEFALGTFIKETKTSTTIQGISNKVYNANAYVKLDFFILSQLNNKYALAYIRQEAYIVNEL